MWSLAVASPHPAAAFAAARPRRRPRPAAAPSHRGVNPQRWRCEKTQAWSFWSSLRASDLPGGLYGDVSKNMLKPAAAVSVEQAEASAHLPKGDMWSVHKFGGTCMGTSQRIQNVADIILRDPSERKLVVVSAMSKVTDMMYNLVNKAQSRDDSYITALDEVFEKHMAAAKDLLGGEDLARFLSQLHADVSNLKAMLRAICIAGHATESFSDFVVGHGEIWSAQLLSFAIKKSGTPCSWMDTREVLVVNPTGSNQVDPDYLESEKRLEKWFARQPAETIIATGFIASTPENIPTTLKRDGSDFSAAIIGSLVKAGQVTIWTDVDGVFSADPRKVSEAVILSTLSYQEAWEMSYFGANVLHPRTIIPVMKYNIPIVIRNMFNISAPGTMICQQPANESGDLEACVKAFATIDKLSLVNVEGYYKNVGRAHNDMDMLHFLCYYSRLFKPDDLFIVLRLCLGGEVGFQAITEAMGMAAVKAIAAITAIIAGGRLAGLSMALGAFLGGLLLAETEFSLQVESDIPPYCGLLLGLLFRTVGMSIDPKLLLSNFPAISVILGLLIIGKTMLVTFIGRVFGISTIAAVWVGLLLAPGGEFAFVALGETVNQGLLSPQLSSLLFLVVGISMALTPWLAAGGQFLASKFEQHDVRSLLPVESEIIAQLLSERLIPFVALDVRSDRVAVRRALDLPVYFGDAGSREVLHKVGAERTCTAAIIELSGL
uniref:aspartate kinase n=1 Tax=Oryza nivara TaxID=4536 RepID=A0A0E0H7T2_ORYNI